MTEQQRAEDAADFNRNSLQELAWAIAESAGQFSLILARCNSAEVREQLLQSLHESAAVEIREIVLDESVAALYATVRAEIDREQPQALIVSGLESLNALDEVLTGANRVRNLFRENFHFPIALWVTDEVLQKLIRLAPDLYSWTTTVEFEIPSENLIDFIQQTADEVFAKVLETGAGVFLDSAALNLGMGSPRRAELESARHELQNRGVRLNPELEASLEFVLGRDARSSLQESRRHYERSLQLWQQTANLERRGVVLHSLGLWWRTYAERNRAEYESACDRAKAYYQQCIEAFEQANRRDVVAKFINALGAILQQLQQWDELEAVATKALQLHQTYPHPFRLARACGFLAEVKLAKSAWTQAQQYAERALQTLESAVSAVPIPWSAETSAHLEWEGSYHKGWYLFSLAKAQQGIGQVREALENLEAAKATAKPEYDPQLYIWILEALRNQYFKQGEYSIAFHIKQEQRSIEQQYGFRAFVGAGRLQPKQEVINPALAIGDRPKSVTQEIAASGRQQDVNRLVERMGRPDSKLTVIHGPSGVGKSSLVQAGLIPVLKQKAIGTRDVVPVLQQVYADWIGELGRRFAVALVELKNFEFSCEPFESAQAILDQLRKNAESNLLTVLVFDQFEEFFFVCKEPAQRKPFYEFLRECLDVPYGKVILSLREDYLHYLLECDRLIGLEVINHNILDKHILYYLGNFSPADAKAVIHSLTATTRFYLEPALIDELVSDLAGELGEVRPIELQVVGTQLQTEKIITLAQYRERGPKEALVGRFLEEVVKDCGPENEQVAKLVLYLLTDENNTRPLKTRADLELELEVKPEKLDLVLEILVKSGLVLKVPALPSDRYQLVHDYLVSFVREQQSARLIAELEKEREQRKLTEAKLLQVKQQQLRTSIRATITLAALLVILGVVATGAIIFGTNNYLTTLSLSAKEKLEIDKLVAAIKAGKELKKLSVIASLETQVRVVADLNQAVYGVSELNRLEGHQGIVTNFSFSRDSQMIATASEDQTAKVWSIDGKNIAILKGHTGSVTSVNFSADGKKIATASKDGSVKVWGIDGKEIVTLKGHRGVVTSVSFSSDGKILASGSQDKKVKLWNIDNKKIIKTLNHSDRVISVSFSPDGKMLAATAKDDTVKLWSSEGRELLTINNDGAIISMSFSPDSETLILTNKDRTVKIYKTLDGTLLKNLTICCSGFGQNTSMSRSPDGKLLALVNNYPVNAKKEVQIVDTVDGFAIQQPLPHSDSITYLNFSPDGKLLAVASKDNTVKFWKIESLAFNQNWYYRRSFTRAAFSPDGQIVAASPTDNKVTLWRRDGTGEFQTHPYETLSGDASSVLSFSPDSKMLIAGSANDIVKLWSLDGREITLKEHKGSVTSISVSPNGQTIAVANTDNTVQLWKNDGTLIKSSIEHTGKVTNIRFSPNSQIIATFGEDNVVKLWKNDGSFIKTLPGHTESVKDVSFSDDSQMIATIGDDTLVHLCKSDGSVCKILQGHTDRVTSIIFSPDSRIVASVSSSYVRPANSEIRLWQSDGTPLNKQPIENYGIQSIRFSPNSQIIASINGDNTVKLWQRNGTFQKTLKGHKNRINDLSFSFDGQTLVTASDDSTVKLWSLDGNQEPKTFREHGDAVKSVSFSPDGNTIVSASADKTVKLWRSSDLKEIKTLEGHSDGVNSDSFSTDSQVIFSTGSKIITFGREVFRRWNSKNYNYTVIVWGRDFRNIKTIQGHTHIKNSFSFSQDGSTVAFVSKEDALKLWSIDGTLIANLKGHSDWINSVSFSPSTIATASNDKTIKLWSFKGKELKTINKHSASVNSVSFSPDGQMLASASDDKTVKLWNGDVFNKNLPHNDKVNSVSFSHDGQTIATASDDNKIKLWNIDGKERQTLEGGSSSFDSLSFSRYGNILAVANESISLYLPKSLWFKEAADLSSGYPMQNISFSPDGKAMAVVSDDGILVWNFLDLDKLLVKGCDRARDYLQNNPNVESDRHLCDRIGTQK